MGQNKEVKETDRQGGDTKKGKCETEGPKKRCNIKVKGENYAGEVDIMVDEDMDKMIRKWVSSFDVQEPKPQQKQKLPQQTLQILQNILCSICQIMPKFKCPESRCDSDLNFRYRHEVVYPKCLELRICGEKVRYCIEDGRSTQCSEGCGENVKTESSLPFSRCASVEETWAVGLNEEPQVREELPKDEKTKGDVCWNVPSTSNQPSEPERSELCPSSCNQPSEPERCCVMIPLTTNSQSSGGSKKKKCPKRTLITVNMRPSQTSKMKDPLKKPKPSKKEEKLRGPPIKQDQIQDDIPASAYQLKCCMENLPKVNCPKINETATSGSSCCIKNGPPPVPEPVKKPSPLCPRKLLKITTIKNCCPKTQNPVSPHYSDTRAAQTKSVGTSYDSVIFKKMRNENLKNCFIEDSCENTRRGLCGIKPGRSRKPCMKPENIEKDSCVPVYYATLSNRNPFRRFDSLSRFLFENPPQKNRQVKFS